MSAIAVIQAVTASGHIEHLTVEAAPSLGGSAAHWPGSTRPDLLTNEDEHP